VRREFGAERASTSRLATLRSRRRYAETAPVRHRGSPPGRGADGGAQLRSSGNRNAANVPRAADASG
jgi:hypothetical protein